MGLWGMPGTTLTDDFIGLFNPGPFAILSGALVVAALVAKRYRPAAAAFTVMTVEPVLSAELNSLSVLVAEAEFVTVPADVVLAVMVTVAVPSARVLIGATQV